MEQFFISNRQDGDLKRKRRSASADDRYWFRRRRLLQENNGGKYYERDGLKNIASQNKPAVLKCHNLQLHF